MNFLTLISGVWNLHPNDLKQNFQLSYTKLAKKDTNTQLLCFYEIIDGSSAIIVHHRSQNHISRARVSEKDEEDEEERKSGRRVVSGGREGEGKMLAMEGRRLTAKGTGPASFALSLSLW